MKYLIKGFFFVILIGIEIAISIIVILAFSIWEFRIPKNTIKTLFKRITFKENFIVTDAFKND
jgi:hypothetical protein